MAEPFCQLETETDDENAFVEAVKTGDTKALDHLLSKNADLRSKIDNHWFAFDAPAIVFAKQNPDIAKVLLEHGANVNETSSWWAGEFGVLEGVDTEIANFFVENGAAWTIHSAAEHGRLDLVKEFLEDAPTLLDAPGPDGQTPLHFATAPEMIALLIERGADLSIRCLDHSGTALQYAANNPEKCYQLIEAGAEPDIYLACALGDSELVKGIIEQTPEAVSFKVGSCPTTSPVHERSHHHIYFWKLNHAETPLEVCREYQHPELHDFVFSKLPPKDQLLAALWEGKTETVQEILATAPDLLERLTVEDQTQLARAAWEDNREAVRLMLECGFDPHIPGDEDSTPLDRAAFHGHREIVDMLLAHDPNPPLERKNQYGGIPLGACVWGSFNGWKIDTDYPGTALALIKAGSKPDKDWLPIPNEAMDKVIREALEL